MPAVGGRTAAIDNGAHDDRDGVLGDAEETLSPHAIVNGLGLWREPRQRARQGEREDIEKVQKAQVILTSPTNLTLPPVAPKSRNLEATPSLRSFDDDDEGSTLQSQTPPLHQPLVQVTKWRLRLIMFAAFLGCFLESLDQNIVSTALPHISSDFASFSQSSWVPSAYLLTLAAFQPIYGKISDVFGRKPILLLAIITFLVGSILCGVAKNMTWLILARGLAGAGGAGIPAVTMVIVSDLVPLEKRANYFALVSIIICVSSIAGPLLGGLFTDRLSWRWCFFFNIPTCCVILVLIMLLLRLPKPPGKWKDKFARLDIGGVVIFLSMMVLLLLGLNWGGREHPWRSALIIAILCAGGVLILAFIVYEHRIPKEPIIPMAIFRTRNAWILLTIYGLIGTVFFTLVFFMPMYFTIVENASATRSGLYLIALLVPLAVGSTVLGRAISRWGLKRLYVQLGTLLVVVGTGLATIYGVNTSKAVQLGCLLVPGAGVGIIIPMVAVGVQSVLDPQHMAAGTTFVLFAFTVGGILGITISGATLDQVFSTKIQPIIEQYAQYADIARAARDDATIVWSTNLPSDVRSEIVSSYVASMRVVYYVMIPIAGIACVLSLFLKKFRGFGASLETQSKADQAQISHHNSPAMEAPRPEQLIAPQGRPAGTSVAAS